MLKNKQRPTLMYYIDYNIAMLILVHFSVPLFYRAHPEWLDDGPYGNCKMIWGTYLHNNLGRIGWRWEVIGGT